MTCTTCRDAEEGSLFLNVNEGGIDYLAKAKCSACIVRRIVRMLRREFDAVTLEGEPYWSRHERMAIGWCADAIESEFGVKQ